MTLGLFFEQLFHIAYFVMLPVFLVAGTGYLVQRRYKLDLQTLSRLSFYFLIPSFVYHSVVSGKLPPTALQSVVLFTVAMIACLIPLTFLIARLRGVPRDQQNALAMATTFYNSANYGLPLQELAFRMGGHSAEAVLVQSFVVITQNFGNFSLGLYLAARGRKNLRMKQAFIRIATFPPIYALVLGLLTVAIRNRLDEETVHSLATMLQPFWQSLQYARDGLVGIMLFTLGAQLAAVPPNIGKFPLKFSVGMRLLGGPLVGLILLKILGIEGLLAHILFISTTTPTAVNTILLCMEFDNHPEHVARAVFFSTLLSLVTVPLMLFLAQGFLF